MYEECRKSVDKVQTECRHSADKVQISTLSKHLIISAVHTKSAECRQKEKKAQCEGSAAFFSHHLCYSPTPTRIIFSTAFVKFNMISLNLHHIC